MKRIVFTETRKYCGKKKIRMCCHERISDKKA